MFLLTINVLYHSVAASSSSSSPSAHGSPLVGDSLHGTIYGLANETAKMGDNLHKNNSTTSNDYDVLWNANIDTWMEYLDPIISICMVVGAVLPYIPQYWAIRKTKSSKGFSTLVCLVLLISNISRIVFWFGKPFLFTLVVQSIVMNLTQILLLELCIRMKRRAEEPILTERSLLSRNCLSNFWNWTDIYSYLGFLIIMTSALVGYMFLFHDVVILVDILGYISTLSDAVLGVPQLVKNFRRKSIVGLSLAMVLMWLGGDIFKTAYFIVKKQPTQFLVCGSIQIVVDLLILLQMAIYKKQVDEDQQAEDN